MGLDCTLLHLQGSTVIISIIMSIWPLMLLFLITFSKIVFRLVICSVSEVSVHLMCFCSFEQWDCSDDASHGRKSVPVGTVSHQVWRSHWWPQYSGNQGACRSDVQLVCKLWFPRLQRSICEQQQTPKLSFPVQHQLHNADIAGQHTSAAAQQHPLTGRRLLQRPPLYPASLLPTDRNLSWREAHRQTAEVKQVSS